MTADEKQVVLTWKPPYEEGPEAFIKVSPHVVENYLKNKCYRLGTEEEYQRFAAEVAKQRPQIICHRGASFEGVNGLTRWEKRGGTTRHCSYCGSVHPDDLAAALESGNVRLGGADWKYGWAHKFYVYPIGVAGFDGKWYNEHLLDLDEEAFARLVPLLKQHTGIEFFMEDGKLMHQAPHRGYQR